MITWTATAKCDHDNCRASTTARIEVNPFNVGQIRITSVTDEGWTVPNSGCGQVLCPVHSRPQASSAVRGEVAKVRTGRCLDSRHLAINGAHLVSDCEFND